MMFSKFVADNGTNNLLLKLFGKDNAEEVRRTLDTQYIFDAVGALVDEDIFDDWVGSDEGEIKELFNLFNLWEIECKRKEVATNILCKIDGLLATMSVTDEIGCQNVSRTIHSLSCAFNALMKGQVE